MQLWLVFFLFSMFCLFFLIFVLFWGWLFLTSWFLGGVDPDWIFLGFSCVSLVDYFGFAFLRVVFFVF